MALVRADSYEDCMKILTIFVIFIHFITISIGFLNMQPRTILSQSKISLTSSQLSSIPQGFVNQLTRNEWKAQAKQYQKEFRNTIYPKVAYAAHAVKNHPIYNFLHTYYDFSVKELTHFSPGINCLLEDVQEQDITNDILHPKFLTQLQVESTEPEKSLSYYSLQKLTELESSAGSRYRRRHLEFNRDVLQNTLNKQPFFGCFGFHEWAMLYSGRRDPSQSKPHQKLKLRVPQETIDRLVETQGVLKCTHYDAWRFFRFESRDWNSISPITREQQPQYEQPACIHANMDLFRYAAQIYPMIPSSLLLDALRVAIHARTIDIRASPYDATAFTECEQPICVETPEGRREYFLEQEKLYQRAKEVRQQLFLYYQMILSGDQAV